MGGRRYIVKHIFLRITFFFNEYIILLFSEISQRPLRVRLSFGNLSKATFALKSATSYIMKVYKNSILFFNPLTCDEYKIILTDARTKCVFVQIDDDDALLVVIVIIRDDKL